MEDTIIKDILRNIGEINRIEQEKYNTIYLPVQHTIELMTHGSITDAETKSALSTFNRAQNAKRQQLFRKTRDFGDLTGKNEVLESPYDPTHIDLTSDDYLKPWGKLDRQQKINRLMSYINELKTQMSLNPEQITQLKQLMIQAVNERQITRKSDVDYCDKTGAVLRIPLLKLNSVTGKFYIGSDSTDVKVTGVSTAKINPIKKLDLTSASTSASTSTAMLITSCAEKNETKKKITITKKCTAASI